LIASCHPMLVSGCMLSVSCVCIVSLGPCLPKLPAWHLEVDFMQVMSVQVCSESAHMTHDPQQIIHCKLADLLNSRHNSTILNSNGGWYSVQFRHLSPYRQAEAGVAVSLLVCRPWINIDLSQTTCRPVLWGLMHLEFNSTVTSSCRLCHFNESSMQSLGS